MSERTALEIASRLEALIPIAGGLAVEALRRQHAEIERLKSDAERVNTYAKNLAISTHRKHFSHITQWEPLPDTIGLITQIESMSCWTGGDVAQLTAEREAAIASAALTERTAIAAQLREWADELGFEGAWRWKTPGGLLYRAAEVLRDRSAT